MEPWLQAHPAGGKPQMQEVLPSLHQATTRKRRRAARAYVTPRLLVPSAFGRAPQRPLHLLPFLTSPWREKGSVVRDPWV